MATFTRYVVRVTLVSEVDLGLDGPTATLFVDAAHGDPVITEANFTGAAGASMTQYWRTLDVDAIAATLPKIGTALDVPPSQIIEAAPLSPRSGRPMTECPACHREVATLKDGGFHPHNTKRLGGVPCVPEKKVQKHPSRSAADRRRRRAPENILELFAKSGEDRTRLAEELGVPWKTVHNWVRYARAKERRVAMLHAAQLHDPGDT
jgi:hypothetical protein